ncbi:MAG TPA: hypothetical protein VF865_18700 [Acidobacteriaceae bacterium]
MNLGAANRRQTIMAAVLGVAALGAAIYVYEELFATDTPAPVTAPAATPAPVNAPANPAVGSGNPAKAVGTTSAALDPTLHMDAMLVTESVAYSGIGRNIFSPNSAPPVVIPTPVSTARNTPPPPPPVPCPPNCPPPPPPPPIDLKFFGTASANGARRALLLHNDDVYLASAGDVVLRRYRVISVDAKSMLVEDMQNNNQQTLPLLAN